MYHSLNHYLNGVHGIFREAGNLLLKCKPPYSIISLAQDYLECPCSWMDLLVCISFVACATVQFIFREVNMISPSPAILLSLRPLLFLSSWLFLNVQLPTCSIIDSMMILQPMAGFVLLPNRCFCMYRIR